MSEVMNEEEKQKTIGCAIFIAIGAVSFVSGTIFGLVLGKVF